MSDLAKRLRIKAGMIEMGERIAWGSDSALMREAADALGHAAVERKKVGRPQIREAFLRNGAVIPADRDDLPDYVYEAAFELLEMAAPAVHGEPVAYMFADDWGRTKIVLGKETAEHWAPPGETIEPLYTAPQPAPDVSALVEALEKGFPLLSDEGLDEVEHHCEWVIQRERKRVHSILASYRKGGDE